VISVLFGRFLIPCFLLPVLVLCGPNTLRAQGSLGASPGLNAALVRLFGEHKAFSAGLEIRMVDGQGRETLDAPMKFSLLDGNMRGDLDVTRLRSKDLPALAAAAAKSVGMKEVVTLVRPDKQESYLLYPAFKACIVAPIDPEDVAALKKPARIQKTPLGGEIIDGHPCVKNKVVVTEPDGRLHEATVWQATDLNDFPLLIQTVDGTDTISLHFRQVRFQKPVASDFDLPAGTDKYVDAQALTRAVMNKFIGEALGGK
jgi:hypothetical protein